MIIEMLANVNLDHELMNLAVGGLVEIDPRTALRREASILGMSIYNANEKELSWMPAAFSAGLENGTIRPVMSREVLLAEAATAHWSRS